MPDPKQAVIEELLDHLEELTREAADTKRTINSLRRRMGQPPMFDEAVPPGAGASRAIRADQFFGKPFSTAAREYIELRGQALPAAEIAIALEQGGFDFDALGWGKDDRARILAITLAKNSQTFVKLKSGTFGVRSMYQNLPPPTKKANSKDDGNGEGDATGGEEGAKTAE